MSATLGPLGMLLVHGAPALRRFAVFHPNPDDLRADARLRGLLARRGIAFVDIALACGGTSPPIASKRIAPGTRSDIAPSQA
ncbi:MAG: hypothetical protein IPN34_14300 [Planctomycetes bacterium]|nr:hypothetical protein [Planctomycetota bacterium]